MTGEQQAAILTIERDAASHGGMDRALQEAGYRMIPASSPEEALRLVVEEHPDLVIVGVSVPDGEGMALARRMKENPVAAHVPIMFISPEGGEVGERIAEVADVYLTAPVHPSVLRLNVRATLRLHAAEQTRSQAFRLLHAVQDSFPRWFAYLDRNLTFVQVNAALCEAVGKRPEELLGQPYTGVIPEGEIVARRLRRALSTGRATRLREIRSRVAMGRKRGPERYLDVSFVPVEDETGAVEGVIVSALDVTAEVRLRAVRAEEERRRRELAEAMNREINHRLKNNLMTVAELLQFQARALQDESAKAALHDAVARLNVFARIHEQLQSVEAEEVELLDLLQRVASVSRSTAPDREVEVSVDGDETTLPTQAATNLALAANELITNGLKHGAPGADGRLRIAVWLAHQGERVALLVWNSGNSVPPDFDTMMAGGMGLHLVQAIAVAHYGGSFDMCPDGGGTVAQVVVSESRLRQG